MWLYTIKCRDDEWWRVNLPVAEVNMSLNTLLFDWYCLLKVVRKRDFKVKGEKHYFKTISEEKKSKSAYLEMFATY